MVIPSNSYKVHYPDGTVDRGVTLLGPMKRKGDRMTLRSRVWIVTETHIASLEDQERDMHFDIHVRPAED
jgi:hypothetical protein